MHDQKLVSMRLTVGPLPSFPSKVSTSVAVGVVGSPVGAAVLNPVPTGPTKELKTAGEMMFMVRLRWSMPVLKAFTTRI